MMTKDRDLKRRIRARADKTGESYQTARRQLFRRVANTMAPDDEQAVAAYFEGYQRHVERFRAEGGRWRPFSGEVPVRAMQAAALRHPNPKVRRECLGVLDHAVNAASLDVFRRALQDPVPRVRMVALHGLSCDRCRAGEQSVGDVVADLIRTATEDPSAKVRHMAVQLMARGAHGDPRLVPSLELVAHGDPDELVRVVARAGACGSRQAFRSRKGLRRRSSKE
jgi:hypothetical protein